MSTRRRRSWRSSRTLLAVVLGALTCLVIATLAATVLPHRGLTERLQFMRIRPGDPVVVMNRYTRPGMERRSWRRQPEVPHPLGIRLSIAYSDRVMQAPAPAFLKPPQADMWGGAGEMLRKLIFDAGSAVEDARGWPALALWCEIAPSQSVPLGYTVRGGIPLSRTDGSLNIGDFRAIPVRPIWRGLAINTAFYAALWLIPLVACPLFRGASRRRRGLCPACAYDLRHNLTSGCPECGWNR